MQNYINKGHMGSPDPLLEFWDPQYLGNRWS